MSPSAKPASTKSTLVIIEEEVVVKSIFVSVFKAAAESCILIEEARASIVSEILPVLISLLAKYVREPLSSPLPSVEPSSKSISKPESVM